MRTLLNRPANVVGVGGRVLSLILLGRSGCSSSSRSASATGSSTGGSTGASTGGQPVIKIGLVTPLTGVLSVIYAGAQYGAIARVNAQNAAGGVNGHKLQLII